MSTEDKVNNTENKISKFIPEIPSFDDFDKEEEKIEIKKFKELKPNTMYSVKPGKIIDGKFGKTLIIEVFEVIDKVVSKEGVKYFTPKSYMAKMMQQYGNCHMKHWLLYKGEEEKDGKNVFNFSIRRK
jgi:hypothetical protein